MKFTNDVDSNTYKRWSSECGAYTIAWYYYSSKGSDFWVEPHYCAYHQSMHIDKACPDFTSFAFAKAACMEHAGLRSR